MFGIGGEQEEDCVEAREKREKESVSVLQGCCKKLTNLVDCNNRNLLSYSAGLQRSKISVSVGLVPLGGSQGESGPCLCPSFWWLLQSLVFLGLQKYHSSLYFHQSSNGILLSVSVSYPLHIKAFTLNSEPTLNPG